MLGKRIGEASGSITGVRVLSADGNASRTELSFRGSGKLLGATVTDIGTFVQSVRPDGALGSEDYNIVMLTQGGEMVSWTGFGAGRLTGRGLESSWGMVGAMRTSSEGLAYLNSIVTAVEYEVGEDGAYRWDAWEWAARGAARAATRPLPEATGNAKLNACPACGPGELRPDPFLVRCPDCGYAMDRALYRTLRQVRSLPGTGTAQTARFRRPPEEPTA